MISDSPVITSKKDGLRNEAVFIFDLLNSTIVEFFETIGGYMQTNLHSLFQTNKELENQGVVLDFGGGLKFTVRRFGATNPKVKALMAKYYTPYTHAIQTGNLSPEVEKEISTKVFVEASLVSWEGVVDAQGNPVEFNFENANKLLLDLPELANKLLEYASDFKNYKESVGNF